ncbi:MAG: hypothetical protein ACKON9_13925 [Planctomycetaceae bacterium]
MVVVCLCVLLVTVVQSCLDFRIEACCGDSFSEESTYNLRNQCSKTHADKGV